MTELGLLLMLSASVAAEEIYYPTRSNGGRDWQANGYRVEGNTLIQVRPNGDREWNAPTYAIKDKELIPLRPDGSRDWSAPVLQKR